MIAGLETPDSGDIIIDGVRVNDLAASKRGIGFVFQNYALFRYMTVYDNIAFGLRVQKADKKKIDERVRELIKLIGLEGLEKRYPSQLSGGQRQRVAFARFVKVTKKNEVQKYKSSASHGVAKNVLFRGDSIEVVVDVDGTELKARRGLDEQAIEVGEEVDVFLYRIFVTVGDKAYLLDNKSISEDSLVI